MRTQLGAYCQQFDSTVRPVLQDLDDALAALDRAATDTPGKPLQQPLVNARRQLGALCDKVTEQQAYVLIFGPLKSGKSTLMNAVAASYVSEVSSLPAYPCLVFVRAGKRREYVVTCYDGTTRTFTDPKQLHGDIDRAHVELASAIREAEQAGDDFDPQEHFQAAIRRVDVHVPDSELEATGAVLVDTPGLYTRMRFGYDNMTREFRNAAACAIFVVKSDTLFLEQVFAEFQQLLDLFSRIFLVVNVDSHKRDVSPDGKLVPSLEQSKPEAVLQAFEQLAMSAPLQRAASDGRVRMYPVDLLHAASNALQKGGRERAPAGFRAFQKDLGDYLASSEYMSAFLRDSLQRADALLRDVRTTIDSEDASLLAQRLAELDEQCAWFADERRQVEQALQLDWTEAFARGQRDVAAEIERSARDAGSKLVRTLGASIDTWFLSSHSLDWLVRGQWTPLVREYRDEVLDAGTRAFEQTLGQPNAGLDLPAGIPELTERAGIDLRALNANALAAMGSVSWPKRTDVPVKVDQIPIKKGMVDRIAFRSLDRIRDRLFGPSKQPDTKLPARDKAARLGDPGRLHLHQCVARFRAALLPQTVDTLQQFFGANLYTAASQQLRAQLAAYGPQLQQRAAKLEAERKQLLALATPLRKLNSDAQETLPKLTALATQFVREATITPAAKDVVIDPQPTPRKPSTRKSGRSTVSDS